MELSTRNKKNIVLIGLSGSGKSSVAKHIAVETGRILFDTDKMIVAKTGYNIPEIFQFKGEQYFRSIEAEVIKEVSLAYSAVISCGGGVVLQNKNIEHLQLNGVLFCLWAEVDELVKRIRGSEKRPLLANDLSLQIERHLHDRKNMYMVADFHINTQGRSVEEIGDFIIQKMNSHTGSV